MSIEISAMSAVLLADGWHKIRAGSFTPGSYEFARSGGVVVDAGGRVGGGFTFVDDKTGERFDGPLVSILCIKSAAPE
jgi:hypothetical protein